MEGPRAVATALAAGATLRFVLLSDEDSTGEAGAIALRAREEGVELLRVPGDELSTAADTVTPQGLLAVVEEPRTTLDELPARGRIVLLDRVQDPGNAGTLIRSAAAFGAEAVVALDGTTDPWSAKCVRSSVGEAFRLPVLQAPWDRVHPWLQERGIPLLVADAGGQDVAASPLPPRGALLVGSEAHGPRPEARSAAAHTLALPLARGVESLNAGVAGSVLLWALSNCTPTGPETP